MSAAATSSPSAPRLPARIVAHPLFWPLATLALLLLGNGLWNPGFLALQWRDGHLYGNLVDIGNRAAPLALVALGMTLVIAVRGLDISVGAVVAIAATVAAWMIGGGEHSRFPLWAVIVAPLLVAAACGLWNGLLVVKVGMQPIIATLILMVAGRGVAQLIGDGQILTIYYPPYFYLGNGFLLGLPFALFVVAAVFAVLQLLLGRTALGLFVRAIGHNPRAARVAGIKARLIAVLLYVFCAFSAGLAGLLISSNVKSADANNAGQLMELDAILAVTLGGTLLDGGRFSLAGSLIGALIIQTLTATIYAIGVPAQVNMLIKALLVFAVMLLQSPQFRASVRGWVRRPEPGAGR
ncbi:ABC transporter permease [Xanthomonas graminis]|jgi:simple sugar transport system permease protein|uniref:ABC transporter permease n=1 Tax=Xanthomonas graminis pv. graminis TaxID=134874 RepID=A0A1M4IE71_9XANT|nr:ABC transporter permease [Xanthomonas translucens]EKU25990.1 Inner membrane ABC transporter permease protein ytfT [Xanthomonas translucens pv. graminis ART-Xtg29]OAX61415.1 sugar ABC transporter permease [Xanthomonas translucens pv. graminis]UKE53485.1 ABC transporter permease [Xanthomonas translucens pv. graminis]WIH07803.1 ABC transporter permease [Xanthomonas translucens pv. graminis]WIH13439.1 ABC transporter permease [Xanthomonas translucens pv. graminis]